MAKLHYASVGSRPPAPPHLSNEDRQRVLRELAIYDAMIRPVDEVERAEVVKMVYDFLALHPFGLPNDPLALQAKITGWVNALSDYPFYAIRRGLDYCRRFSKEPHITEVVKEVRDHTGAGENVLSKLLALRRLIAAQKDGSEKVD